VDNWQRLYKVTAKPDGTTFKFGRNILMAVLNTGLLSVDLIDFSKETQQHSIYGAVLNAGNFAAQATAEGNYLTALAAISSLNVYKTMFGNQSRNSPKNPPTDMSAQRELQWGVVYVDVVTGQIFTHRIGGPVLTANLKPNSDHADLAATDIAAYVTAFEAYALSPAGNAVTLTDIVVVGKNDRAPNFPRV
jgi:hypothetical protein